jgi:hypothetical protein
MSTIAYEQGSAEYDKLPEGVKLEYSFEEWMWLSDHEKTTLVSRETSPEGDE